jgi:ankyrin repeat protein
MQGMAEWLRRGGLVAVCLLAAVSCRKPTEASKSDLEEAGYSLTTADWLRAAERDDLPALKKFVAAGFEVAAHDESGNSALHAAAGAGALKSADYLLKRGLSIDLKGNGGRTPLMSAVLAKQTSSVRWLLRQGADPRLKDADGFSALMLAVREGATGAVAELAPYHRDSLDSAILLAALVGQTEVIDTLTNYGASVYARMEDGRTPLMIAAENGHKEAVELLLDIGASRFSTDAAGHAAADLANKAGHPEIASLILREPEPAELALESTQQVAQAMDTFVDAAAAPEPEENSSDPHSRNPSQSIDGQVLGPVVQADGKPGDPPGTETTGVFPMPPLAMRHYREREMPVEVRTVANDSATLVMRGAKKPEVTVAPGETIPGSRLTVVRVQRRMEGSKLNLGQAMEVSVVEVRDNATGVSREWISGMPASAHDPVALVEDASTGLRYTATPGQRFKSADGAEFVVSDVRPNQIVIEDAATKAVRTLPLRGPRG